MADFEEKLKQGYEYMRNRTDFVPKAGLVLGSGLGMAADRIKTVAEITYDEIPGFPVSTVAGHAGKFILGYIGDTAVIAMKGRVHYYEGYPMQDVVLPIRLMGMLGAKIVLLTNAAGGINEKFAPGDLMMLTDHISTFVQSPMIGFASEPRFVDMTEVYDPDLRKRMTDAAEQSGISLKEGIYLQVTGPQYETPAEIRMFRMLGADAVGMSTVCEAIAARQMGMRVCGVSCITNMAAGIENKQLSHDEVRDCALRIGDKFSEMICRFLTELRYV